MSPPRRWCSSSANRSAAATRWSVTSPRPDLEGDVGPAWRIGTAGWSIPRSLADQLPGSGSHLDRYADRLDTAEINSSFHRPHRPSSYARWAASVGPAFRFAIKLPKTITHERRLVECRDLLARFADDSAALGMQRGPTLVQLPPSLIFAPEIAAAFLADAIALLGASVVCEPRHPSWFMPDADALLAEFGVARVAADPAPVPAAADPGGWRGLAYFRLHGSPVTYRSSYRPDRIGEHAARLCALARSGVPSWTIFDNTASGAALADALLLRQLMTGDQAACATSAPTAPSSPEARARRP